MRIGAYFTVEASFLVPMIIILFVILIKLAIVLYGDVTASAGDISALSNLDSMETFLNAFPHISIE